MAQAGLVGSINHLISGGIATVSSRLRLLAVEVTEERDRVVALVIAALIACFFVFLAVIFAALLVVAAYWNTPYRYASIGWMAGGALAVAIVAVAFLVYRIKQPTALFHHSLAEFEKDQQMLEARE